MNWADRYATAFRALGWGLSPLGKSNVWLMFKKDLRQTLTPCQAKVPITIDLADRSQADEVAAFYHDGDLDQVAVTAAVYKDRLGAGSQCFVARIDGQIVAFDWLRVHAAMGAAEVPMLLRDDEVYGAEAYTSATWRGRGIHPALNYTMLKFAQERGYRTAYTQARADNAASLATLRRMGWALSGTLLIFEPAWAPQKSVWLVRGSPYPMPVGRLASQRVPTLAELLEQWQFDSRTLIKSRPWSLTYRLHKAQTNFYLKIVPREHAAGLKVAMIVARAYPEHVPPVVACNHAFESWLLVRDHGGTGLDDRSPPQQRMKMLETYASLQARAAANSELLNSLPRARIDDLVQALLEFLGSAALSDGSAPAGAAFYLGAAEARRFLDALSPHRAALEQHIALAQQLPRTLNHGNLRPTNAAVAATGDCVLLNWTRAMSGPAGLSLHALFGGRLPATLRLDGAATKAKAGMSDDPELSHYVQTLARCGYADEQALCRALPASITAGMLLDVLHLAGYPMETADELAVVRDRLAARLNQMLELFEHLPDPDAAPIADAL